MTSQDASKEAAAKYAVAKFVTPGIRLGLGSGTTAAYVVHALAHRIRDESLSLSSIVSTSDETASLARSLNIVVDDGLSPANCPIDVTIDGADDVDYSFNLIKGGGGALLREKIVARASLREVIVIHESKYNRTLGTIFPLPIMIVPYGWEITKQSIESAVGRKSALRKTSDGSVFVSNDGLYCIDVIEGDISDPAAIESKIRAITGVVDVGLFVGIAKNVVIGHSDGSASEAKSNV